MKDRRIARLGKGRCRWKCCCCCSTFSAVVAVIMMAAAALQSADAVSRSGSDSSTSRIQSPELLLLVDRMLVHGRNESAATDAVGGGPRHPPPPVSPSSPILTRQIKKDPTNQHLHLDFSGRIETLILGSSVIATSSACDDDDDRRTSPVVKKFALFANHYQQQYPRLPSLLVAADYDFSKRWYGATRLSTTLRFFFCDGGQSKNAREQRRLTASSIPAGFDKGRNLQKPSSKQQRMLPIIGLFSKLRPSSVDLTREQGLNFAAAAFAGEKGDWSDTAAAATVMACRWPVMWRTNTVKDECTASSKADDFFTEIRVQRVDNGGFTCATLSVPWHRRFRWECRLSNSRSLPEACFLRGNSRRNSLKQQVGTDRDDADSDDDWWIPNVRVDALGQMESTHEVWLSPQRVGFQFSVRRRLNWSALGILGGDSGSTGEQETTVLRFQVKGLSGRARSATTVSVESQLERPLASARLLLRQDVAVGVR